MQPSDSSTQLELKLGLGRKTRWLDSVVLDTDVPLGPNVTVNDWRGWGDPTTGTRTFCVVGREDSVASLGQVSAGLLSEGVKLSSGFLYVKL
jgi:hypothetical protein